MGANEQEALTEVSEVGMKLLHDWYVWWFTSYEAPAKMPKALHVKTALLLQEAGYDIAPDGPTD